MSTNTNNTNNSNEFTDGKQFLQKLEDEAKDIEAKAFEKEKKLHYLITLIKDEREVGNEKLTKAKEELKYLQEKLSQLRAVSIANIEDTKRDILTLQRTLDEMRRKSNTTESQIKVIQQSHESTIPNQTASTEELTKQLEETKEIHSNVTNDYEQLKKDSKLEEETLKKNYSLLIDKEKALTDRLNDTL
ncbi:hypothetical protein DFA_03690 [Cavenderia fasciculata]|uniref:Uncharacterized protein n=1 Tax=Cavenderia fasciculata TaxID=261658 RepID=F4Q1Q3_CACFS|nr:uncharacterized protein DFA_03690 [Cavenderia fasciculata]EGG18203.1 hypothetical protein DFA_03690 [Cavenderia fasciculata]|eukprot:XP_004357026.1 hypothetical protein DFA_03690 [Cavenderia fasciculata]